MLFPLPVKFGDLLFFIRERITTDMLPIQPFVPSAEMDGEGIGFIKQIQLRILYDIHPVFFLFGANIHSLHVLPPLTGSNRRKSHPTDLG